MSKYGYGKNMNLDDELDEFDDEEYDEGAGEEGDGLFLSTIRFDYS